MSAYYESIRQDREDWRARKAELCMVCGWESGSRSGWGQFKWLETHEIERRSQAAGRWARPCNYLLVCNLCHAGPLAAMPHARQLAHKLAGDAEDFDLEVWLRIRDPDLRAPERVTMDEIREELEGLGYGGG
jgi:hypothetical protein